MKNIDVSRLVNLGVVPARRFFAATDSLAELTASHGRRTFLAAFPSDRVLSIGLYQDAEIDLEEAATRYPWPMLRRSVGGHEMSVVPGTLLFSMIIPQDDAENSITRACRGMVPSLVATCRSYGVDAHFTPPDSVRYHRILFSAVYAGCVGNALVLTGTLPCTSEEPGGRNAVEVSLSGISKGAVGPAEVLDVFVAKLGEQCRTEFREERLSPTEEAAINQKVLAGNGNEPRRKPQRAELRERARRDPRLDLREAQFTTAGGRTIGLSLLLRGEVIETVAFSGDFVFYRDCLSDLETALHGVPAEWDELMTVLENYYIINQVDSPGVTPADWVSAIDAATGML